MNWLRQLSSRINQSLSARRTMAHRALRERNTPPLRLEALEPRVLLSADPLTSITSGALTATFSGDNDVVDVRLASTTASGNGGVIVNLRYNGSDHLFGDATNGITGVSLDAGAGNDTITLVDPLQIPLTVVGGAGDDTLKGADEATQWLIDGSGSGSSNSLAGFSGFEHLIGGSANDLFTLAGGSLASVDGGAGSDTLLAADDSVNTTLWQITGADAGSVGSQAFLHIENLTGGVGADTFQIASLGSISGLIDGGRDDDGAVDTLDYSAHGSAVQVDLHAETATAVAGFTGIDALVGSAFADTLSGPGDGGVRIGWEISGANAGSVEGVAFAGFESLVGRDSVNDVFSFLAGSSLSGTIAGGNGGADGFAVQNGGSDYTVFNPASTDASGTTTLNGVTVRYAGIDHLSLVGGDGVNAVINGTSGADRITIKDGLGAKTSIVFDGTQIYDAATGTTVSSIDIDTPLKSLTIQGGTGADTITVESLDPGFTADLLIFGNKDGAPELVGDLARDTIVFAGNIKTGVLKAFAETIKVNAGVTLDVGDGYIEFRARRFGTAELENLSPVFVSDKSVSIDVGANAQLIGGAVYLIAQAEDRSFADIVGVDGLTKTFLLDPAIDKVTELAATLSMLPVKVLVKEASARVTLGQGVKIDSADTVGIYATAGADASGTVISKLFSVGFAQAKSTATITVADDVDIRGRGAVNLTSDASATASMSTATAREMGAVGGSNKTQVALSLAISNADVTAKTTVAERARIRAGTTLNVRALGAHESGAEAESGLFSNGLAGLALALQFSKEDVLAEVNGSMQADMTHPDGAVVKLEFDPNKIIDYALDTIDAGDNWVVVTEDTVNYQPRRGTLINTADGGLTPGQDYYIIHLVDDPTTPTINEGGRVRLATTEQKAIDGGKWEEANPHSVRDGIRNPFAIDLTPGGGALNSQSFTQGDVDANANTITIRPGIGPFELGQSVIYRENWLAPTVFISDDGTHLVDKDGNLVDVAGAASATPVAYTPTIAGLTHNTVYWTLSSPNQFGLQGDNRLSDSQVLKLGKLENEVRGGLTIDIGAPAGPHAGAGFTLSGVQVLDSGFATFGVTTGIDATDSASASAGIESADNADATFLPSGADFGSFVLGGAFGTLYDKYTEYRDRYKSQIINQGDGGESASISVAGALAFSYTDHEAYTHIGSTADLNSADDMELRSELVQHLQLSAESDNEPQENQSGAFQPGASAAKTISVAAIVGIENNSARAIIDSGAELDSMRALRLISAVTYPYLTRPDEYIPLSGSELVGQLKNDGYDSVNDYLDGTLGLKSKLFNTWARSTAKADDLAIGGSVNVLVFNNVAESIVHSDVKINQDPFYRPLNEDPADNGLEPGYDFELNHGHSANANNVDEHVVSIEATNYMQFLDVTGVFDFKLPSATVTPGSADYDSKLVDVNVTGSSGKRGGVGGAIYVSVLDNTTHAIIEDGVSLYSGSRSGLNVKAEEAIFRFQFSQAGASAGKWSIAGTLAYAEQDSDILAHIESGVAVGGGRVDVYAGSLETNINWVGAVAKGEATGLGLSAGINNIHRKTRAIVGDVSTLDDPNATASGKSSVYDLNEYDFLGAAGGNKVDTDIDVRAKSDGELWAFTVAGTLVKDGTPTASGSGTKAGPSKMPTQAPAGGQATTGLGIAGAVSINLVEDDTLGYINDSGSLTADDVSASALNDVGVVAATGGVAVTLSSSSNGKAFAGAFSLNLLTTGTQALILGPQINARNSYNDLEDALAVEAKRTGNLVTVAVGAAGSTSSNGLAIGGSISVNNINNDTRARIDHVGRSGTAAHVGGAARAVALDDAGIIAIGGAAGVAVQGTGVGAALGFNQIDGHTEATLGNSYLSLDGALTVRAENDNALRSVAVAVGAGKTTGIAFTFGVNLINNEVSAEILDTSVAKAQSVTVLGRDDSVLQAIGGAIGIGLQGTGFGGALGWNSVFNTVKGRVERSTLSNVSGAVSVRARATEDDGLLDGKISSAAIGAAGSGQGSAVGGALAINGIINTVDAHVSGGSSITAGGNVEIDAYDSSSIKSLTGGAALGLGGAGVGFGLSANFITNTVSASVDGSSIDTHAGTGSIAVNAHEAGSIDSIAIGLAGGDSAAVAGSVTANIVINKATASVVGASNLHAAGNVRVTSKNSAHVGTIAGQIAASGGASVGASITNATIVNETKAWVDGVATVTADVKGSTPFFTDASGRTTRGVSIEASSPIDIMIFAIGGAVGTDVGIAGSFSVTVIDSTTEAFVKDVASSATAGKIDSKGDVNVVALTDLDLIGAAGSIAIGGTAGVGLGADVGVATLRTRAYAGERSQLKAADSVVVQAFADEDILSISFTGAGSGTAAVGVTAGVSVLSLTTEAWIGRSAGATADANVVVQALDTTDINLVSGSITGAGTAAIGASGGVSTITKNTRSWIAADAQIVAKAADGEASFTANTGTFDNASSVAQAQQQSVSKSFTTSNANAATNRITIANHGFSEGDQVVYSAGAQPIVGLTNGGRYVVHKIDNNTIELRRSAGDTAPVDLRVSTTDNGGPPAGASHELSTVAGVGTPRVNNPNYNDGELQTRAGTAIRTESRRGVIVTALSANQIATAGVAAGVAGTAAVTVAGSVSVHTFNTEAHVDAGADLNADNTGAGALQGVYVDAGRSLEELNIGVGAAGSGVFAGAAGAAVPVVLGGTKAWIGNNDNFATDSHTGSSFATVVNARGDVEVRATAQEKAIAVAAGVAVGSAGVAGSGAVFVMDTATLAAISGDVRVATGGNVLVQARDDTRSWVIAGGVGVGLFGGGAGAAAVSVVTKKTDAVIGGGAVVDADGRSTRTEQVPTGETDGNGKPLYTAVGAGLHGVAVQARSSENLFALGASVAGGLYVGIAGAVSVEVLDADTTAQIIGGAEINQNNAASAAASQSVDVSAVDEIDLLSIDGAIGVGAGGIGASVDVAVIRNDTIAVVGGTGTKVRARDSLDVNALARRDLSSNTISVAAGGLSLAGSISVFSVGGNFDPTYSASDGQSGAGHSKTQDALAGDSSGNSHVTSEAQGNSSKLAGGVGSGGNDGTRTLAAGAVDTGNDTIAVAQHRLQTGDKVRYHSSGAAIGGLQNDRDYYVIKVDEGHFKLADTLADAMLDHGRDLTGAGSGTQTVQGGSAAITDDARGDVADSHVGSQIGKATAASTGLSSGTTAAIDTGARVVASDVGINARNRTRLDLLTGGVGVGGTAGLGLGVVVANVDSDVSAFVAHGTVVDGIDADGANGGDGDLIVNAKLDSVTRAIGFAGAAGGFIGLGSAVSVVHDTSDVRALIGARVNASGAIDVVGTGADIGKTTGFANVKAGAESNRTLRLATGAAGVSAGAGLGIAVTVAGVSGSVDAGIGDKAEIGSANSPVGNVVLDAKGNATVKPYSDGGPMGIALAGGLLAGAAGVTDVRAGTTDAPLTINATVGQGASIDAGGDITLRAASILDGNVRADGGAIGAIAVGAMVARSDLVSTTQAGVGNNARVSGRKLSATADNTTDSAVGTVSAAGGLGAGVGTKAETNVRPKVVATIGTGAIVTTTDDVKLQAVSTRAKGSAQGFGVVIGGAAIGVVVAEANVTPQAYANVGDDASIVAGGNVEVLADILAKTENAQVLDDNFRPAGGDVNTANDTIHFVQHGLSTGGSVVYDRNGNPAIATGQSGDPSLDSGREYRVVVVDADTLKLGATFTPGAADTGSLFSPASGVDAVRDRIRFDAVHRFITGDAVKYSQQGGSSIGGASLNTTGTFYVRRIDDYTVKLFASRSDAVAAPVTFNPATSPSTVDDGNVIHLSGFSNGQAVTYYAPEAKLFSSLMVDTDAAKNTSFNPDQPAGTSNLPISGVDNNAIFLGRDTDNNGSFETGHGFNTGDKLTYRTSGTAIGNLTDGATYYAWVVDANKVQLLPSYASLGNLVFNRVANADDTIVRSSGNWADDGFAANQKITISGTTNNNVTLTIKAVSGGTLTFAGDVLQNETSNATLRATDIILLNPDKSASGQAAKHALVQASLGVLDNGRTYYVVNSDGSKFQLANAVNSAVLDVSDSGRSGTHGFGKAGIELTAASGGPQQLAIDLAGTPSGDHKLLAPGGISLRDGQSPPGNGVTSARVEGGGGGGLSVSVPTARATITNDAQAWIAGTLVQAGKDITVATQSVSRGDGYIVNGGGGIIQAADVTSRVTVNNLSKAYLTGDGVTLKAGGQVAVKADSNFYTHVYATADGAGLGAGSNAKAFARIDSDVDNGRGTIASLGQGARIESDTLTLNAQVSGVSAYAHTRAVAVGFVAVAISESDVDTDSDVQTLIAGDVRVKATRGVDIGAFHRNLSVDRATLAIPIAFIPVPIERGGNHTDLSSLVEAKDGARLQTAPRANSDTVLRRLNPLDGDAANGQPVPPGSPAYNSLALLVQASDINAKDVSSSSRRIEWDADVEVAAGASPEVVIAADGTVEKAIGATVDVTQAGKAIVGDISGGAGGQVVFIADQIQNDAADAPPDLRALFQFADTYAGVTITNKSTRELTVNNINVGVTTDPFVDLQGSNVGLTFNLRRNVAPTAVVIQNTGTQTGFAPDIVLAGTIDNPIGQTLISAAKGDIVAATARGEPATGFNNKSRTTLIVTRNLQLDALQGTIGYDAQNPGNRNHLAVDIVQSALVVFDGAHQLETGAKVRYHADPSSAALGGLTDNTDYYVIHLDDQRIRLAATSADAFNGIAKAIDPANLANGTHSITVAATNVTLPITSGTRLVAQAGADDQLDLKGRLRDPAAQLGTSGTDPHVFQVELIRGGLAGDGSADVILQSAVKETATGNAGGVRVRPRPTSGDDKTYFAQFRPDTASAGSALDVGYFGNADTAVGIKATYNFVNRPGGTAGLVAAGSGNIVVVAKNPAPSALQVNVTGITDILGAGSGHIDVLTNGFVTLTEQAGDMRVGSITSNANDVTLTAPASIVDALDDTAADVTGVNITLKAVAGGIGSAGSGGRINFLEINLLDSVDGVARTGVLRADAPQNIYLEETADDLRVHHVWSTGGNVTLVARAGSIVDGHDDLDAKGATGTFKDADGRMRDAVNVFAFDIDLDANGGGSIGLAGDDLDIDSRAGGRLFAEADANVYLTEVNGELEVLAARAIGGTLRLTVPDTSAVDTENLVLLDAVNAAARIAEAAATPVTRGEILAGLTATLWIGDNVTTAATSRIVAGGAGAQGITIRGDTRRVGKTDAVDTLEVDDGRGTRMTLRGTIGRLGALPDLAVFNANVKTFTQIFGHDDVDTFTFDQTKLDANTTAFGGWSVTSATLDDDGEDQFIVDRLQSMHVFADGSGDTLTLDGQADTDTYTVYTTGTRGAERNYVVNVLDTGRKDDDVDTLDVYGIDGTQNNEGEPTDDIFLLRRSSYIPDEAAEDPAFVALLTGTLAQARDGSAGALRPPGVQRVNYDANLNGRLTVYGLGGNDYFAIDDNSAVTTIDAGKGADTVQIGQLYGSSRKVPNVQAPDQFEMIATTRGYMSRGATMPIVVQGGDGNDTITVYANKAELRLEGDDGDDLFIVRAFALAQTDAGGNIILDANGVATPLLTSDVSTQGQMNVKPGDGNDTVQYNINAPVSIDGGNGFDKVVILGTEFPDNFVITKDGVSGAGVNVRFQNIEVLEVDGLEGDDDFYVLSTPVGVATRLIGGLGSDGFNVGGDVAEPIAMQQLEGASSAIGHLLMSGDSRYDRLAIDGIDPTIAQAAQGAVVITESNGSTVVTEGPLSNALSVDSYFVHLATRPADGTKIYVTVSAARSTRDEETGTPSGDTVWIAKGASPGAFTHTITVNGAPKIVPDRAVVLVFDASNYAVDQQVSVYGVNDTRAEGERTVAVSHIVSAVVETAGADAAARALQQATIDTYNRVKVRNVEAKVIDNDAPGLVITQTGGGTMVLEGDSTTVQTGSGTFGIADSYNLKLAKELVGSETVDVQLRYDSGQLALSGAGVTVGSPGVATVRFTSANWSAGIEVKLTAVDDAVREDFKYSFIDHKVSASTAAGYLGLAKQLAVEVYDNDHAGVIVQESDGSTRVTKDDPNTPLLDESLPGDTYTLRLTSKPTADVTISVVTDGQTSATPTPLTFTAANWWQPQTVTVRAVTNPPALPIDSLTQKEFAPRPHLLTKLGGPLAIEGGTLGNRALVDAVLLPTERNQPLFQIGAQPDERDQIDVLNIFDDSSIEDKVGTLTAANLSGLGLAPDLDFGTSGLGEEQVFKGGITFGRLVNGELKSTIEVLNVMLGEGNDKLTITGTLNAADEGIAPNRGPARHGTITLVHGGGNLPVSNAPGAAIGGDTITLVPSTAAGNRLGGSTSPLVIYGDTSQDGLWYGGRTDATSRKDNLVLGAKPFDQVGTADDLFRFPRANPFDNAGNDIIDARLLFAGLTDAQMPSVGVTIYGGGGNDTIWGSQAADHIAGGSGDDVIHGQRGADLIYGDSGFNVDLITRTLFVPTIDGGYSDVALGACATRWSRAATPSTATPATT